MSSQDTTTDATASALDAVHDGRHKLRDLPLERESMPYIVSAPEHGLATTIYTWVDKDNKAGALFVVTGPVTGGEPIIEMADGIDVGPDMDFDDWQVGPAHIAHNLDLRTARLRGTGERIAMDLTFEATHPAYAYSQDPRGCPAFAATDRLEQSGRVAGTVTVDGEDFPVHGTGARDHSWGTRDWNYPQHWKWVHAQNDDIALHFWEIYLAGRTELRGYVVRNGRSSQVTDVNVDFQVDDDYRQKTIDATVTDRSGRTTRLTGEYFGWFELPPASDCLLVEGGMSCEIDGVPGSGWSEFMWPTPYLEHLKSSAFE